MPTGADVDEALSDFDEFNDTAGLEFDEDDEDGIQRWHFPRFIPPCPKCHTPMVLDDGDEGTFSCTEGGKKEGHAKKFSMDLADQYLSRTGIGSHDSDVETIAAWLDVPRNIVGLIILLSEPGTGKTALLEAAVTHAERTLTTILCTPDHTKDDLLKTFVGEDHGDLLPNGNRSPFTLGPLARAAKEGHVLYMDEVLLLEDGVKPILYSLSDGRRFLPEGNVDGSPLEIHPDFRLVASSNPLVRGASLPEPLASRAASTTMTIETSADMLRDLDIDDSIVAAWEALGQAQLWRPQIREMRIANHWLPIDPTQAVSAFLPEHCPETMRNAVRDMVVGYLGGDIRPDGRLTVR